MNGYFNPLRRKLGMLTLVLACVFAAGWVRSLFVGDRFYREYYDWGSLHGEIYFLRHDYSNGKFQYKSSSASELTVMQSDPDCAYMFHWRLCGFGYGAFNKKLDGTKSTALNFLIPYWSIVIPLILVSAWMLLSKPRAGKNTNPSSPIFQPVDFPSSENQDSGGGR